MKIILLVLVVGVFSSTGQAAIGISHRLNKSKLRRTSSWVKPLGTSANYEQQADLTPIIVGSVGSSGDIIVSQSVSPPRISWKGPACIIGGALAHLTLGTLYCWGNFLSYAPSKLRFFDGIDRKGVQPDALYVMAFTILAQAVAMPFGPSFVKVLGASRTLLLGSWIAATAVFLASYQDTLKDFIFFYSLMFGAGAGLAYTAPMAAGWSWLPDNKGLVSGGILAGFGAGGFIFNLIGSSFANPTGLNTVDGVFPPSVYRNFPTMLRKLAVLYAALSLVGASLVNEPTAAELVQINAARPLASKSAHSAASEKPEAVGVGAESVASSSTNCSTGRSTSGSRTASAPRSLTLTVPRLGTRTVEIEELLVQWERVMDKMHYRNIPIDAIAAQLPPPVLKFFMDLIEKVPFLQNLDFSPLDKNSEKDVNDNSTAATLSSSRNNSTDAKTRSVASKKSVAVASQQPGVSSLSALFTHQFWLIWTMVICSATAGLNTASVYKLFAASSAASPGGAPALGSDQFLTLVGGMGALANGLGRIFWGSISDKIGFKNSFTLLTVLQTASMLSYYYSTESQVQISCIGSFALLSFKIVYSCACFRLLTLSFPHASISISICRKPLL
jgi:MFS family permease